MRKSKRNVLLAMAVIFLALGLLVWHGLFAERTLATIELPAGDRIVIGYEKPKRLLMALAGVGGLRYHVYSGGQQESGWLTSTVKYDFSTDVNLKYEILGDKRVKISARNDPGWIFAGDAAGVYEISDLSK